MLSSFHPKTLLATGLAGFLFCVVASAQETNTAAATGGNAVLASSLTNTGVAEANLVSAIRDGDKLLVRVRFKATKGASGVETLYAGLSESSWQTDTSLFPATRNT